MKDYIIAGGKESYRALKELKIHNKPVQALKPFENKIDFVFVITQVERLVPEHLMNNIDAFYVGNFKEFAKNSREFNAMYKDGAIYISPDQDNEEDLLDDIIHEIAHSLENEYRDIIYGDNTLEFEFLGKRKTLHYLVDKPILDMVYYNNPDYNATFDKHLYKDIGYDKLRLISAELFYSPYAITSLREYWANGFENYLLGDKLALRDLSPALFSKITEILENSED
mgnify:FL=1